jgi:hypothetical protein
MDFRAVISCCCCSDDVVSIPVGKLPVLKNGRELCSKERKVLGTPAQASMLLAQTVECYQDWCWRPNHDYDATLCIMRHAPQLHFTSERLNTVAQQCCFRFSTFLFL